MRSSEIILRKVYVLLKEKFINEYMAEKTTKIINKFNLLVK